MTVTRARVAAVTRKELRDYRRNGNAIYAMAILPLIFIVQPVIEILTLSSSSSAALRHEHTLIYMLGIPALVPAALASYAVVGERVQGTLEPLLTTPIRREELVLGKALAAFIPSVVIAYLVFGIFAAIVAGFAAPGVAAGLFHGRALAVQLGFTPLIVAWSIWIGIAVSARSHDIRAAAQVSILVSLPTVAVTSLLAFNVLPATLPAGVAFAVGLTLLDRLGWSLASSALDRERLITGTR